MGYVYHGSDVYVAPAPREVRPLGEKLEPQPCGTKTGYERHMKNKEAPCEPCKAAGPRKKRIPRTPAPLQPCGTRAAYQRHKKANETPCVPCKKADNRFTLEKRERRRRKHDSPGSTSGFEGHDDKVQVW